MNVLHLISSSGFFGAERVVCELCRQSARVGIDSRIAVLTRDERILQSFRQALGDAADRVTAVPCGGRLDLGAARRIRQTAADLRVDIVHSHGYKSDIYAYGTKRLGALPARLVATNHNWIGLTLSEKLYQRIDAAALRGFDGIVAVSEQVRQDMAHRSIPAHRIEVIHNGIDPNDPQLGAGRGAAREQLGLDDSELVVGTVARLTAEKNLPQLVEAVASLSGSRLPHARLVIVGDGPERARLEAAISGLGMDGKVKITGTSDRARSWYAGFDVFALPSLNEGLPMVLLEAMAAGVPVVASAVGAVPAVVEDDVSGLLVTPGDSDELTAAILRLCADGGLRKRIGGRAREVVCSRFSSHRMAERYSEVYRAVTAP